MGSVDSGTIKALVIKLGGTHANCAIVANRKVLASQIVQISGNAALALARPHLPPALRSPAASEKFPLNRFSAIAVGFCGQVHGVMRSGSRIVNHMDDTARHAWIPRGNVEVRAARLGNDAALLGAVPLISDRERSRANVR